VTHNREANLRDDINLELVPVEDVPDEVPALVYETLYSKLAVPREPMERWYDKGQSGRFLVARKKDGDLLGVCRLMPLKPERPTSLQIRQVVVSAESQGMGLGRLLMLESEKIAKEEGVTEIFLWSRYPAYRFYENLDYEYTSEPWVSEVTTIEHRTMTKQL